MIRLNGVNLLITKFPNQESMIVTKDGTGNKRLMIREHNEVSLRFETNEDLIYLMFLKKHIDEKKLKSYNVLKLDYMPYSRMDRSEDEVIFTLKYICEFINSLNFDKVIISEPHSNVCVALLDRVEAITNINSLVDKVMHECEFEKDLDFIYYPDTTAEKRQSNLLKPKNNLTGLKHRDFSTGNITGLEIIGDINKNPKGRKVIMVDDLCSKGTTFIKGAEKLKELGFSEIYLVVEHCEYSILDGDIFKSDLIDKVYTTNSIISHSSATLDLENKGKLYIKDIK